MTWAWATASLRHCLRGESRGADMMITIAGNATTVVAAAVRRMDAFEPQALANLAWALASLAWGREAPPEYDDYPWRVSRVGARCACVHANLRSNVKK